MITQAMLEKENATLRRRIAELEITARRQTEQALLQTATPDAMIIIDATGTILMINAQTETLFGYAPSELIGAPVETLLPSAIHGQHIAGRTRFMAQPLPITPGAGHDIFARRKNGEEFPVEISLSHHPVPGGEPVVLCTVRDVTERKRAREVIAAQRDLARLANANLPQAELWESCFQIVLHVSGMDSGGIYLLDNLARTFDLVYHCGLGTDFVTAIARIEDGTPSFKMILAGKPLHFTKADMTAQPYYTAEGLGTAAAIPIQHHSQVLGCLNIASHTLASIPDSSRTALEAVAVEIGNIIVHQRTEEALQASREQLSQALIAARMGTWRWHIPANRLEWSPEAARIFGVDYTQTDFTKVVERFYPDDRARLVRSIQEAFTQKQMLQLEYRILDPQGKIIWVTNYGHITYTADGKPLAVTALIQDITERKQAEENLRESEEKYRRLAVDLEERVRQRTAQLQDLYDHAPAGYHSLDADGNIVQINQTALNMLGYTHADLLGKPASLIFAPPSEQTWTENFRPLIANGEITDREMLAKRKDGTIFPVTLNTVAVYDANGQYVSSRTTMIDISERKRAEAALQLANAELQRAIRIKDEFLASMSHELRTPLTAILGLAESLSEQYMGALNEEQLASLQTIESSGRHLLALINDILDLSKLEASQMILELGPVMVQEVCQSSLLFVKDAAHKKHIQVTSKLDPAVEQLHLDGRRLKQMLVNLLNNAVKFTPEGGQVELQVNSNAKDQTVSFSVSDTGIGIAQENLTRLFQPFVQLDSGLNRRYEGTGLGLALVARMVKLHGGSVTVASELGKGSCFTITLPWQTPQRSPVGNAGCAH